ncbi:MAG: SAM-dependent methyltransferase [Paracoccaceae bacterium]
MTQGRIICAGLGPGDPDLISVRSDRAIRAARHVAYFRKAGRLARPARSSRGCWRRMRWNMRWNTPSPPRSRSTARNTTASSAFYDDWSARLQTLVRAGAEVVVLCEGDPSSTAPSCTSTPG